MATMDTIGSVGSCSVGYLVKFLGESVTSGVNYTFAYDSGSGSNDTSLVNANATAGGYVTASNTPVGIQTWPLWLHATSNMTKLTGRLAAGPTVAVHTPIGGVVDPNDVTPPVLTGTRGDTQNLLQWNTPTTIDNARISTGISFTLQRSSVSGTSGFSTIAGPLYALNYYLDTARSNGVSYWYRVTAQCKFFHDVFSVSSPASNVVMCLPRPIRVYVGSISLDVL